MDEALEAIRIYIDVHGWAPTFAELGEILGVSTATARARVRALARAGRIETAKGARCIRLLP